MTNRYHPLRTYLGELLMMAAIVTTLLGVPLAALLAAFFFLIGASLYTFVTFGGALNAYLGAVAWWLLAFVPTLAYAAYVMPWDSRVT